MATTDHTPPTPQAEEPQYSFTIEWTDEDESFIALCPEFPGLSAFGDTHEEAMREARVALGLMIEVVEESGEALPAPLKFLFGRAKAERAVIDAVREWRKHDREGDGLESAFNDAAYNGGTPEQVEAAREALHWWNVEWRRLHDAMCEAADALPAP